MWKATVHCDGVDFFIHQRSTLCPRGEDHLALSHPSGKSGPVSSVLLESRAACRRLVASEDRLLKSSMDFQDSLHLVSGQGAKTALKAARERWPPAEIFPGDGGCWGPAGPGAGLPPFMLAPGGPPSARPAESRGCCLGESSAVGRRQFHHRRRKWSEMTEYTRCFLCFGSETSRGW